MRPILALRMAVLGLRRSPGPTLLAIGILALRLAAPVTFFSLLVGAIRPLPVPEGERVVRVDVQSTGGSRSVSVSGMALPSLAVGRIPGPAEGGGLLFLRAELWHDKYGGDPAAIGAVELVGRLAPGGGS